MEMEGVNTEIKMKTNLEVRALQPKELWNYFADLNAVPRPSKKEEKVIEFIKKFGLQLGLETIEDHIGNVIIKKPASPGMENRETVMMQSHLDMVHQKNNDTFFDFDTQGIEMFVDGDWVKAKGTTLGADNGIGVATIMALLASKDIAHPAIEALFTIDEETGMTGALNLKAGLFKAKYMLNLDTEDDRELTIGCAGGIDVTANGTYTEEKAGENLRAFKLTVKGLTGGHSGMDIYKGRGNANKIMNRLLRKIEGQCNLRIGLIDGGSLRNAIPRESVALVCVPHGEEILLQDLIEKEAEILKHEFAFTDPNLIFHFAAAEMPEKIMNGEFQHNLLQALENCHNGVFAMSPDIEGLVQTSNNLARVIVQDGSYTIMCLTRSSVDEEKMELANGLKRTFEGCGAEVSMAGSYPGWAPKPGSAIVQIMSSLYKEMFMEEPHVNACHAGLECGIIGANYPDMDMVSFGPNITGAHSPDEQVQIGSVQKYWEFLLETLKRVPERV
jgi:dipeptidase D